MVVLPLRRLIRRCGTSPRDAIRVLFRLTRLMRRRKGRKITPRQIKALRRHPAGHRTGDAGRSGKSNRQAALATNGEVGKSLRLERVSGPPYRVGGRHRRRRQQFIEQRHQGPVVRAAAGHDEPTWCGREIGHDPCDGGCRQHGQRRGAVGKREPSDFRQHICEVVAVERFRRQLVEVRILPARARQPRPRLFRQPRVHRPRRRPCLSAGARNHQSGHCPDRYRRRSAAVHGAQYEIFATPPMFTTAVGPFAACISTSAHMIDRNKRRALPASSHVRRAKIIGHGNTNPLRQRRLRRQSGWSAAGLGGGAQSAHGSRRWRCPGVSGRWHRGISQALSPCARVTMASASTNMRRPSLRLVRVAAAASAVRNRTRST